MNNFINTRLIHGKDFLIPVGHDSGIAATTDDNFIVVLLSNDKIEELRTILKNSELSLAKQLLSIIDFSLEDAKND